MHEMDKDTILTIERDFNAPPETIYDAWIDPELFVKWWGPEGMTTPVHSLDIREGGSWSATMENSEGQRYTSSGIYKVLDRPNRLVFTWAWDHAETGRGHETEVEVTISATASGSKLVLVQGTFESMEARDSHNMGWSSSFNDLDRTIS